jgi:hypothetical protein
MSLIMQYLEFVSAEKLTEWPKVMLESPFKGKDQNEEFANKLYAREAMADCFAKKEIPFASHLLYTQQGILNDAIPMQRLLGISAGLSWVILTNKTVVYTDLGISEGMKLGIIEAERLGHLVEYRSLPPYASINHKPLNSVRV